MLDWREVLQQAFDVENARAKAEAATAPPQEKAAARTRQRVTAKVCEALRGKGAQKPG